MTHVLTDLYTIYSFDDVFDTKVKSKDFSIYAEYFPFMLGLLYLYIVKQDVRALCLAA